MKRYGNIRFVRRVVVTLCLLVVAVSVLMPVQSVRASDTGTKRIYRVTQAGKGYEDRQDGYNQHSIKNNAYIDYPDNVKVIFVTSSWASNNNPTGSYVCHCLMFLCKGEPTSHIVMNEYHLKIGDDIYYGYYDTKYTYSEYLNHDKDMMYRDSDMNIVYPTSYYEEVNQRTDIKDLVTAYIQKYANGEIADNVSSPTKVTNESIGYLQDVKLNLSYVTPIKGDSIFETTNYQIYSDMIYNLKWNGKKTTTDFDLTDSYVQLYAKAEYKSERNNNTASDFFALSDSKASLGKYKVSFMELFEKSSKCKSAYLSDYPLSSADYKNGKLQACSVTSNIKYKFYIRVYKGTDKGPWLCVSEKGSHHSNEFVNSGVKVPFNVSSGDLVSDGTYKPDGNINENGNGITGTGTDKDDADADTNANDKIQSKHDSSDNSVWDNLENLVSGIASVPIIIKDIFSFLPSWCLNVTATGFALMITVCVIKFIRGK